MLQALERNRQHKRAALHVDRQAGHYTLDAVNPESLDFVYGMLDELIPLFTSGKFNICCDETFDLGEGRNREIAAKVGKDRLYLDFVKKIISHVKSNGKTVMMWGDILMNCSEAAKEIPEDVVILNWDYTKRRPEKSIGRIARYGLEAVCLSRSGRLEQADKCHGLVMEQYEVHDKPWG